MLQLVGDVQPRYDRQASLDIKREAHQIHPAMSSMCRAIRFVISKLVADVNQDPEMGGISDRAGDMVDVFHTCFGIAGLSLLGHRGVEPVNPI